LTHTAGHRHRLAAGGGLIWVIGCALVGASSVVRGPAPDIGQAIELLGWSPDSRLVYFEAAGRRYRMDVVAGSVSLLAQAEASIPPMQVTPTSDRRQALSPDGRYSAAVHVSYNRRLGEWDSTLLLSAGLRIQDAASGAPLHATDTTALRLGQPLTGRWNVGQVAQFGVRLGSAAVIGGPLLVLAGRRRDFGGVWSRVAFGAILLWLVVAAAYLLR
jgi:hypothetical protein